MILCGLDFETTWVDPIDPSEMRIIEIGAVLYDTERRMPIEMMNTLVVVDRLLFTEDITKLTGISMKDLINHGLPASDALINLSHIMMWSDYVVAHNGNKFDKIVYNSECARHKVVPIDKPWIDTRIDVTYPDHIKTRKLTHLAADHGFANPFAHRALFDVLTMMQVMSHYDFNEIVEMSKQKTYLVTAEVSFQDKQQAKDRSYFWNADDKKWQKEMKEEQMLIEQKEAPFYVAAKEIEV